MNELPRDSKIKIPQRLKGFNDFFSKDAKLRQYVCKTFIETFEKYGYEPLETPALEYSELMLGQSGEDAEKLYYRFRDNGDRDVMLKYENMISMARAVAQNVGNITFPYKRYQIQRVWRAENVQKGRYRELTQCDADTIGSESLICDAEFIQAGIEFLDKLGFDKFEARISNRKFLEALAEYTNVPSDKFYGFSMSIDKLDKIGQEAVIDEMINLRGISNDTATMAMSLLNDEKLKSMSFQELIDKLKETIGTTEKGKIALGELQTILDYLISVGVPSNNYRFDPTIARGLASYTGPVWEFVVIDGNVGSVGGCGRYDKAIGKYIGYDIPATGGSFGLERLCDVLKDRNMIEFPDSTAEILVTIFDDGLINDSARLANELRQLGLQVMLYPNSDKLGKQYKFADKKQIKYVLTIGPNEKANNQVGIKNMLTGEESQVNIDVLLQSSSSYFE